MKLTLGLLAGVVLSVGVQPALAADADIPAAFDWTGLTVGVGVGYALGDATLSDDYCDGVTPGHCQENNPDDPNYGLLGTWVASGTDSDLAFNGNFGFAKQFDGGLVLGGLLELGLGGSFENPFQYGGNFSNHGGPDNDATGTIDLGLTGAAKLQAGLAMDRFLPYVTAGVAFATFDATLAEPDNSSAPRSDNGKLIGWTVGAGMKYAATDSIIIGVEYDYTDYGSAALGLANPAIDQDAYSYSSSLSTHEVKATLGFKF